MLVVFHICYGKIQIESKTESGICLFNPAKQIQTLPSRSKTTFSQVKNYLEKVMKRMNYSDSCFGFLVFFAKILKRCPSDGLCCQRDTFLKKVIHSTLTFFNITCSSKAVLKSVFKIN